MRNLWPNRTGSIHFALLLLVPALAWAQKTQSSEPAAVAHAISSVAYDTSASTRELMESAREMFIARRYDLSEMLYKSVLVRDPNNVDAMQELAIIYEATGQLEYAKGLLTRALIQRPADPEIIRRHADIVQKLSRRLESEIDSLISIEAYEPAIPKLAILLTNQPENADLYFKKANCHLQTNNPEAALVEIERAQKITREQRFADLKTTASAAKHQREIDRLTTVVRRALRRDTAEGRDEALQTIGRILEIDPTNEWAKSVFVKQTPAKSQELGALSERMNAWWALFKKNASGTANQFVSLTEIFRSHLGVLLTILLALVIFVSPLTRVLVQGFSQRHALSGHLEHFRLDELLSLINTHHRTGVLILKMPHAGGKIYFENGEVYHSKSGRTEGRAAVEDLLKETSKGVFVFKNDVVVRDETINTPLSLILLGLPERATAVTSESILKKQKQQSKMNALLNQED